MNGNRSSKQQTHPSTLKAPHDPERWIWLELIGFDNSQRDFGVGDYLNRVGFVPDAISLLLSSIDIVLQHKGMRTAYDLPPDICSREGHENNQDRKRQKWTNFDLRGLVRELQKRGVTAYLNVFNQYHHDRYHREWASDHPEVRAQWSTRDVRGDIHILKRLADGTHFEDIFIPQLVTVMRDYGFDGWHGGDGFGDVGGAIYAVDFSDDLVGQFQDATGIALPSAHTRNCGDDFKRLQSRSRWIWRHRRQDWIQFYADRSTRFWRKAVEQLHGAGMKAAINSSRARDPFETLYICGYDYRKLAATGVDTIVTETVSASLALDPRSDCSGPHRHDDFLAQLMMIKACMPTTKLVFLHALQDSVEQWDAIRHAPTIVERETYSQANLHIIGPKGKLERCADGFLACLGDGIRQEEWQWLQRRWKLAFEPLPQRVQGATVIWSDTAMDNQVEDFTATRTWPQHRILYYLMTAGAPVQTIARIDNLDQVQGPILVLNLYLYPEEERQAVLAYRNGPIIAVTRNDPSLPKSSMSFSDVYPPHALQCVIWGASVAIETKIKKADAERIPTDMLKVVDTTGFWDVLYHRTVSSDFISACAEAIAKIAGGYVSLSNRENNAVLLSEMDGDWLRLAIKSRVSVYTNPTIELERPILETKVRTEFPLMPPLLDGTKLTVRIPPKGIVVVDVRCAKKVPNKRFKSSSE